MFGLSFPVLLLGFMGGEDKSAPGRSTPQRRLALGLAKTVEMRAGLAERAIGRIPVKSAVAQHTGAAA